MKAFIASVGVRSRASEGMPIQVSIATGACHKLGTLYAEIIDTEFGTVLGHAISENNNSSRFFYIEFPMPNHSVQAEIRIYHEE